MPNRCNALPGAGLVRRCLFGGALFALGVAAIVHPGDTDAVMPPPAGFCTVSGAEASRPLFQIGFFSQWLEESGSRTGGAGCSGPDRTRVIVEAPASATPTATPAPAAHEPIALH